LPPLLAQSSRGDIKIFIPRPVSNPGIFAQQDFFAEQFKMEITAANYTVTDRRDEADYLVQLTVDDNEYYGEPDEKQYILTLALTRTEDGKEIVRFAWPFTDMTEMYQWNLYLVYQAMANVPLTKEVEAPTRIIVEREVEALLDDHWRNKWLYLYIAAGLEPGVMIDSSRAGAYGFLMPAMVVGMELQFLNFMSAELDLMPARFTSDGKQQLYTPAAALLLKGIWKPGVVFMVEPYAGIEASLAIPPGPEVPPLSMRAGLQYSIRMGSWTAVTVDAGVSYNVMGEFAHGDGSRYNLLRISLCGGVKLGFKDRPAKGAKNTPDAATANGAKNTPDAAAANGAKNTPAGSSQ
jgi:hypothetical protein